MEITNKLFNYFRTFNVKRNFKTIFPYLMGIVSGIPTYFLYSHFNRDIVTVQSVSVRQKDLVLSIDQKLANKLEGHLVEAIFEKPNLDLTTLNKDNIIDILKILRRKSASYAEGITGLDKLKIQVGDNTSDSLSLSELDKHSPDKFFLFRRLSMDKNRETFSKQEIIDKTNAEIASRKAEKSEIDELIKDILQKTGKALSTNKDKFQIEIIAFNEGNQQTVIRNKGTLLLGQTQVFLTKVSTHRLEGHVATSSIGKPVGSDGSSNSYLIIEPKSFIVLNLEIDNFNNKDRDIEVIKREYISGQSKVTLNLYDIKNSAIEPFEFLFENDIESTPNDGLNSYISELGE